MDLSELTPELFEKTEFTERRRGYDIDQVETFLEETGTAVAQLLVRHRQLEERATNAEARLAETERRLAEKPAPAPQPARSETDEVERATSTLLMAKRTADATLAEAEAEAEQVRSEATGRADSILAEARTTAAEELDAARRRTTEVVTTLEARRDAVAAVVEGLEKRIDEYRGQFVEAARHCRPWPMTPRCSSPGRRSLCRRRQGTHPEPEPTQVDHSSSTESAPSSVPFRPEASVDLTDATQVHDTAAAAADSIPAAVQVSAEAAPHQRARWRPR
ncbi:MAG: DivIVA domain-containing protein [Microthrixaceae bacterium]